MSRFRVHSLASVAAALLCAACRTDSAGGPPPAGDAAQREPSPKGQEVRAEPPPPATRPVGVPTPGPAARPQGDFAANAFPPTAADTPWHRDGWEKNDCLRCHETGVENAPQVVHRGMPDVLLTAKCRTCHVLVPGQLARGAKRPTTEQSAFAEFAFPPMVPASDYHRNSWTDNSCLLCHESGNKGAPLVRHENMPAVLLTAKCRSCHVQVRAAEVAGR